VIWMSSLALAVPPDQQADLVPVLAAEGEGGVIDSLTVTSGGEVLVGRLAGTRQAFVLDLDTWAVSVLEGTGTADDECSVTGITAFESNGSIRVWTSCSDGAVEAYAYDDRRLGARLESIGIAGSLSAIVADPRVPDAGVVPPNTLYAIELPNKGFGIVHAIDPADPENDNVLPSYPLSLTSQGYVEAQLTRGAQQGQFSSLVVSHGTLRMSTLVLSGTALASPNAQLSIDCDDMAPAAIPNAVYCLDTDLPSVQLFNTLTNTFVVIPGITDLVGPRAVGASDTTDDNWLAVTGDRVTVWELDPLGVVQGPPVVDIPNTENPMQDIVSYGGYLFGGGSAGRVHVVTARPWIERESFSIEPVEPEPKETVTVTFTIAGDDPGPLDWQVLLGGGRTGGGTELDAGTANPGEIVESTFEFDVGTGFSEGVNDVFVVVTDGEGLTGHIVGTIAIDNPPGGPRIPEDGVRFGNRRIAITFDGIDDADLDRYEVYVSTTPFERTDFPTGGPTYDGNTRLEAPFEVEAEPGIETTINIQPLENDVEHYIAIRAIDSGGQEGAMSNVVSEIPSNGCTAAECSNEIGGSPCSEGCATQSSPASWGMSLAVLLGLGAVRRRRQAVAALAALATLGTLTAAAPAWAQDDEDLTRKSIWMRRDSTPVRGNFEFRYGSYQVQDEIIGDVYQDSLNMWQFEAGPQIFRFLEIDLGMSLVRSTSNTVRESDGAPSADEIRLTIIPVTVDVSLRAHILDEQPVVPFFRYGWDYAFFNEQRLDDDRSDPIRGAKTGSHIGAGINVLIDTLAPNRASLLEAQSGINDTWLTLEWRRNRIDNRSRPWQEAQQGPGFDFSGDVFSVGLKLDY